MEKNYFTKEYMPQFRDADESGLVGARGYLNCFQDVATQCVHNFGKGNDTIPEVYDCVWLYTKYRLRVEMEADFTSPLEIGTWIEEIRAGSIVYHGMDIRRQGELMASGRLECCIFDRKAGRLARLSAIDFPEIPLTDRRAAVERFSRMGKGIAGMELRYAHTVRYTDLDKSRHMTNLRYVDLFLNAFDSGFFQENRIRDIEIHYLSQCYEQEEISVYAKRTEEGCQLAGVKEDGTVAAAGLLRLEGTGKTH